MLRALKNLFNSSGAESELKDELNHHLQMQIEQNLARGMSESEARRKAVLELGGVEQVKEACREVRPGSFADTLVQDVRYGVRTLRRERGFAIVAILTLALAIAATTAIFSVAKALLLQPLPYPDPDRIVALWNREKDGSLSNTSYETFLDWKNLGTFESLAAISYWQPTLTGHGDPELLDGSSVTADFFKILGVQPMLGRAFLPSEDRPDHNRVVILSYGLWERRFQKDPDLVGKQIMLNGIPRTVVGIMPRNFQSLLNYKIQETEIWRPLGYDLSLPYACRTCNHLSAIARLRSGISLEQASRDFDSFMKNVIAAHRKEYGIEGATLLPLREQFVAGVRLTLSILFAAVALVLLIACANTAGLMLARGTKRSQELVVRSALGASRSRLLRQLLTESFLLALSGGVLGVWLARSLILLLILYVPEQIPRMHAVSMDYGVLGFAAVITMFAGILFGIVPAWTASRISLTESLHESHRITTTAARQRFRRILVAVNVGLALILVAGSGLVLQSIRNQMKQNIGFDPENLTTMTVDAVGLEYEDPAKLNQFWKAVSEKVNSLPGIQDAGMVSQLPLSKSLDLYSVRAKDKPLPNPEDAPSAERFAVDRGYMRTMKIPLLQGRFLNELDRAGSAPVVVINRQLADAIWPGENPIGKQVQIGGFTDPWRTVVGVVGNVRHRSLQERFHVQLYHPAEQWPVDGSMTIVIRSRVSASVLSRQVKALLRSIDPKAPISNVASMRDVMKAGLAQISFLLDLLQVFAIAALLLAAIGIYGVMSYTAAKRRSEIAIRMALGAGRTTIFRMLTREAIWVAVAGVTAGLAGCVLLTRFLKAILFGVTPLDPATLMITSGVLLLACLAAAFWPSLVGARQSPVEALRNDG